MNRQGLINSLVGKKIESVEILERPASPRNKKYIYEIIIGMEDKTSIELCAVEIYSRGGYANPAIDLEFNNG